jgi:hypothetical protein
MITEEQLSKALEDLKNIWSGWRVNRIYIVLYSNKPFFLSLGSVFVLVGMAYVFELFGTRNAEIVFGSLSIILGFFSFSLFFAPKYGVLHVFSNIKLEFFEHIKAYSRIRNFKYKPEGEAFTKDFLKSQLYPYKLSKIRGYDYFSGLSGNFPFLIWNVWAWFQEKSFQSPMTSASVHTAYIGFAGDQLLFKNQATSHGHLVVFPKKADEYYADLLHRFKVHSKFKQSGFSAKKYSNNLLAFRTSDFSGLNSSIFDFIIEIIRMFPEGAAFHFSPDLIFVNIPHEKKWLKGNPFENPDKILKDNILRFFQLMSVPRLLENGILGKKLEEIDL